MNCIIDDIRKGWKDSDKLQDILLEIVDTQFKLSEAIANQERTFADAFVAEKGDHWKGSDSLARQRARQLVGTQQTQYEFEFQTYTNLIGVVTFRISQLHQQSLPNPVPSLPLSEAI